MFKDLFDDVIAKATGFRSPTEAEAADLRVNTIWLAHPDRLVPGAPANRNDTSKLRAIEAWLDAHPKVRVDTIHWEPNINIETEEPRPGFRQSGDPLIVRLAVSPNPLATRLLKRVLDERTPNPYHTGCCLHLLPPQFRDKTALESIRIIQSYMGDDEGPWAEKAEILEAYQRDWDIKKRALPMAKDVAAMTAMSKSGFPQRDRDVEGLIASFLSGKEGSVGAQMSQLRTSFKRPGVPGSGRHTKKKQRRKGRKTVSRRR